MRGVIWLLACALCAGCAASPSNGGLWAKQGLDQELAVFRQSEQARLLGARSVELEIADELLEQERTRLHAELAACPSGQPFTLSRGNRLRDAIRVRAGDDQTRLTDVARLAQADWFGRRGLCDRAAAALAGAPSVAPDVSTSSAAARSIAEFATGVVADADRAATPLPRYLMVVYGGSAIEPATDLELVDQLAPAHPEYEPDALWLTPPS
jgi:hypothetical protein